MATTQTGPRRRRGPETRLPRVVLRARRRFLKFFPEGFQDPTYLERERNGKWEAHEAWEERLSDDAFRLRLDHGDYAGIAADALQIESRTNLLLSAPRMALRDAIRQTEGARQFAEGLYAWLYGEGEEQARLERWVAEVDALPHRQARVLTWPLVTVFVAAVRELQEETRT
jgi:hypothetical protein